MTVILRLCLPTFEVIDPGQSREQPLPARQQWIADGRPGPLGDRDPTTSAAEASLAG